MDERDRAGKYVLQEPPVSRFILPQEADVFDTALSEHLGWRPSSDNPQSRFGPLPLHEPECCAGGEASFAHEVQRYEQKGGLIRVTVRRRHIDVSAKPYNAQVIATQAVSRSSFVKRPARAKEHAVSAVEPSCFSII
jgi:hypothetical protein